MAWLVPDLHGNVAAGLAQDQAAVTDALRYDGYGITAATWPTGGSAATANWKYQGRLDLSPTTTSLYDFAAREYSPGLGAFTSLDSVLGSAQNPWQLNRFLYAAANPATLIDPDGHASGLGGPAAMTTLRQAWQPSDISAHYLLGLIGMFPGIGIPFNAVDAALYAAEGDYVDAALSAVAAVPIAGPLAKLGRVGKTVEEAVKATEEVVTVGRDTDKVLSTAARAVDKATVDVRTGERIATDADVAGLKWDATANRYRGPDGRFAADPARVREPSALGWSGHGNSLDSPRPASLYRLYTDAGEYLKTGMSQNPYKRYSAAVMKDKYVDIVATGTRRAIAALERSEITAHPGPLNRERWL